MITKFHKLWVNVFLICFLIWFLFSSQYLTIADDKRWLLDVNQNREILFSLKENEKIKLEIDKLNEILLNKRDTKLKDEFMMERFNQLLSELALTEVQWEWFILIMNWKVNVSSIIDLVSTLWFANIEAVSINDIRINSKSYFWVVGDDIMLNWINLGDELTVKIIWEKQDLEKYLLESEWIIKHLKDIWINTKVEYLDKLIIFE